MSVEILTSCAAPVDRASREAEFHRFCALLYPRVARYCQRLVRDAELARDITQESFARVLARWITIGDPEPYVFHVATNLARDAHRRFVREAAALERSRSVAPQDESGPDAGRHALHLAVYRLPRRYRDLVLLHYFADLPLVPIAAAVRRPVGTVKRQLAEARALLAVDLESR